MNKASGGDGIPVKLFQNLKDDAVKVLHSICQQILKTQQWPQDWKRSVFIPIPEERQCQEMLKLPHNFTHLTHQQSNAQNSPSQASAIREPWTSRCPSWILKMQGNQKSNYQYPLDYRKSKRIPENRLLLLYWLCQSLWLYRSQKKMWKILQEIRLPYHLTCLLRNLYAG